jgi:hypothetical protein
MNGSSRLSIAMCAVSAAITLASPVFAADASNGKRLAERWCTGCHLVSSSQSTATDQVPPFASIAKMPDFSAAKIALFLLDPHPKMHNICVWNIRPSGRRQFLFYRFSMLAARTIKDTQVRHIRKGDTPDELHLAVTMRASCVHGLQG